MTKRIEDVVGYPPPYMNGCVCRVHGREIPTSSLTLMGHGNAVRAPEVPAGLKLSNQFLNHALSYSSSSLNARSPSHLMRVKPHHSSGSVRSALCVVMGSDSAHHCRLPPMGPPLCPPSPRAPTSTPCTSTSPRGQGTTAPAPDIGRSSSSEATPVATGTGTCALPVVSARVVYMCRGVEGVMR